MIHFVRSTDICLGATGGKEAYEEERPVQTAFFKYQAVFGHSRSVAWDL